MIAAAVLLFLITLCFRKDVAYYSVKFTPVQNLRSYLLGIRLLFADIFHTGTAVRSNELIAQIGTDLYGGAFGRLKLSVMTFTAGAALAIAGALFQSAYKNPMASPNILGVTAGVNIGNIVMLLVYGTAALQFVYVRYQYCYAFTAACVIIVLLLGKAAGNKRDSVSIMEMVMVGSIVSQLVNAFVTYYMYTMEDEELAIYEQISLGAVMNVDKVSFILFISVMAVSILPVLFFRYRLNVLSLGMEEAKVLGVRQGPWRIVAQVCGVLMSTAAMIHCGQVGMITMVVPYIVRDIYGSDFRKLCAFSALIGGALVMTCQFIASFFMINDVVLPATFVVNLVTMPAFMIMLARRRQGNAA